MEDVQNCGGISKSDVGEMLCGIVKGVPKFGRIS